ncbi:hypothetical protein JQC92_06445 [Shewanella sp. 202IG2-18]|uniref:AhpA/YtjB family protein n=1 Tax=Parashewanella hymeniacidonis TaxID=2807618 RepID=UPI001960F859|nr:hypothetical protein [Parashewanella hymeniacidonis]
MLHLKKLKKSHKFSLLVQFAVAVALIAITIQLWQANFLQSESLLEKQASKMSHLLLDNVTYAASSALQNQKTSQLQWLVESVTQDPRVISAAIYDAKGSRVAFAQCDHQVIKDSKRSQQVTIHQPRIDFSNKQ